MFCLTYYQFNIQYAQLVKVSVITEHHKLQRVFNT